MKGINAFLAFLSIGFLTACTTTGYRDLPVTPLTYQNGLQGAGKGFIEDAIQIHSFSLFPDATSSKIEAEFTQATDRELALRKIQALVCDGLKPRVPAKFNIHLVPPKPEPGVPLNRASASRAKFLNLARDYVQNRFLDDASDTELTGKTSNDAFADYQQCVVSVGADRKCGKFSAEVITVPNDNKKQLEDYYRNVRFTPTFRSFGNAETIYHWREQFMATVFTKDHLAILTPKVATIRRADYANDGSTTLSSTVVNSDNDQVVFQRSPNLSRHVHFAPSATGYKINGENAFPMMTAVMRDLAILKSNFSFVLPKSVVPTLVDLDIHGKVPHVDYQYFGVDPETKSFSPEYATKNADHIWTQYLKHQTSISEAVQDDDSTRYELSLDLTLFCNFGTPVTDLMSH